MRYVTAQSALAFAAQRDPEAGDCVGGVTLTEEIGRGGMARVFRGRHERLGVDVAVKVLLQRDDTPEVAERFAVEAHALAKLDSPHIVRVLDFGLTEEGAPFIVTELLHGQDLATKLRAGPLPPGEVIELISQIADGLTQAHAAGVIHRDVKPSNVYVTEGGHVKLIDFGAAKSEAPLKTATTITGVMIGTPLYMSPEQLTSPRRVDPRADVWSLAVVAYELLAGVRPFEAETVGELAVAQTKGLVRATSTSDPALRAFDSVFARAFHPELAKRHRTAAELRDELVEAMRPTRRAPSRGVILAFGLAATLALASSVAWATRREESPAPPSERGPLAVDHAPLESVAPPAPAPTGGTPSLETGATGVRRPSKPLATPGFVTTARPRGAETAPPVTVTSVRKDRGF